MRKKTRLLTHSTLAGAALLALLFIFTPQLLLAHKSSLSSPANTSLPQGSTMPIPGTTNRTTRLTFQHIFLIVMENKSYSSLIGNPDVPWINQAAKIHEVATSYYGIAHPSQPNYLALTSGSTQGVKSDATVTVNALNIVDQLEAHRKSWKAYMQALSANGNTNKLISSVGDYARKHNPFVSYADIQKNPARMARIVDFSQFASDLANNTVPDFAWITPDLCHDMHGRRSLLRPNDLCANKHALLSSGDAFLRATVDEIMHSRAWTGNSVIFITWDESVANDTSGCCATNPGGGHILTLAISRQAQSPLSSNVPYNHYSLLATIEQNWNLGCLGATCDTAHIRPMSDLL